MTTLSKEPLGRIHSFQSLGAVDGPGLRYVIFMQGCQYRCPYCHNPDTRPFDGGIEYSADEITEKVKRYVEYFGTDGGVTVSGGEPLCQREFLISLFKKLKAEGISTAIDTAGVRPDALTEQLLDFTDIVLCDIKFPDDERYKKHLGISLSDTLDFLSLCEKKGKRIYIRHVVVPGMTDSEDSVKKVFSLAENTCTVEKFELLPFRKMCITKYNSLGIPFPLADTPECPPETIKHLREYLASLDK